MYAWLQAARPASAANIQLPPALGQSMAYAAHATFSATLCLLLILYGLAMQLYIVFLNDRADHQADALNQHRTPFSGGSRVLVDGQLRPRDLYRAGLGAGATVAVLGLRFALLYARPIILLFGGWQVIQGTMSLGVLLAFVAYMNILRFPITILALSMGTLSDPIEGHLTFDRVSFSYGGQGPLLSDITFDVDPREHVALIGLTGAGKSTFMPRFYLPTLGRIYIDHKPITDWQLAHLRSQISTVRRETFLFSATIAEKIAFARPDVTREEVRAAARHGQIDDFINALPEGYKTIVGEYGVGLSGRQRQRVAIARTILQDPRLLILDDCTSSLDAATERRIENQLRELMEGRTTVIMAQRVSTLVLADRIIVLNEGRIADADSHDRLMNWNELYRTTYPAQTVSRDTPISESWG